jgi:hypothetical protein
MKTPTQELIEAIMSKQFQCEVEWQCGYQKALNDILFDCKKALEKEKLLIQKSYKDHHDLGHIYGLDTEKYYNQNYNLN